MLSFSSKHSLQFIDQLTCFMPGFTNPCLVSYPNIKQWLAPGEGWQYSVIFLLSNRIFSLSTGASEWSYWPQIKSVLLERLYNNRLTWNWIFKLPHLRGCNSLPLYAFRFKKLQPLTFFALEPGSNYGTELTAIATCGRDGTAWYSNLDWYCRHKSSCTF